MYRVTPINITYNTGSTLTTFHEEEKKVTDHPLDHMTTWKMLAGQQN
jgi:hypothetical protein